MNNKVGLKYLLDIYITYKTKVKIDVSSEVIFEQIFNKIEFNLEELFQNKDLKFIHRKFKELEEIGTKYKYFN